MPTPEQLLKYLQTAVGLFNDSSDKKGLLSPLNPERRKGPAASEMAIAHRLAVYLEQIIPMFPEIANEEVVVDCEYNRHRSDGKRINISKQLAHIVTEANRTIRGDPENEDRCVFSVLPDIVVHERRTDAKNLLVIELKKETNPENREYDQLKLKAFTLPELVGYGYQLGATIVIPDKLDAADRALLLGCLYRDGVEWSLLEEN